MKMNLRRIEWLIGGLAAITPAGVAAQLVETSTIQNTYSYNVGGQTGAGTNSGGGVEFAQQTTSGTGVSEMFLSLNGTLDQGSFLFLHNGTCVGTCSLTLTTDITFSLFNSGSTPLAVQFDSQITPGHLANSLLNTAGGSQASFNFTVTQDPGLRQGLLYQATGDATETPPTVSTSTGQDFNGLSLNDNSPEWSVLDWSATDLSVALAIIAPGQTSNLYYRSTLTITTSQSDCLDPTLCESFQVAFGDPRNAGGVVTDSALQSLSSVFATSTDSDPLNPAVGATYDPFRVTYRFVPVSTPAVDPSPVIPPLDYDINYRSPAAVPEPGTWMLLILGFGFTGAMLRKRRAKASFAFRRFRQAGLPEPLHS